MRGATVCTNFEKILVPNSSQVRCVRVLKYQIAYLLLVIENQTEITNILLS